MAVVVTGTLHDTRWRPANGRIGCALNQHPRNSSDIFVEADVPSSQTKSSSFAEQTNNAPDLRKRDIRIGGSSPGKSGSMPLVGSDILTSLHSHNRIVCNGMGIPVEGRSHIFL